MVMPLKPDEWPYASDEERAAGWREPRFNRRRKDDPRLPQWEDRRGRALPSEPPSDPERLDDLSAAAAFMLELVDQYYGTDHEFDIPAEAEFRYHRAVISAAARLNDTAPEPGDG